MSRPHAHVAPRLHLIAASAAPDRHARADTRPALGAILRDMRAVAGADLARAQAMLMQRQGHDQGLRPASLADILLAEGWVGKADLIAAEARRWGTTPVDLVADPPDPRLIDALGLPFCARHGLVPLTRAGAATVVATAHPEAFHTLRPTLEERLSGPVLMVMAPAGDIDRALAGRRATGLIRGAEMLVPAAESCRTRDEARLTRLALCATLAVLAGALAVPVALFALLVGWAILTMVLGIGLKILAFGATWRASRDPAAARPAPQRLHPGLPVVSMMVPMFGEADIAPRLVERLGRQSYPKDRLDVMLVVEEGDRVTRAALAGTTLPAWMRVITVPDGPIRTKPRALNYALNFARGDIVGVWDAEDAPAPDQIRDVVARFDIAAPDVACLQGMLDFYNPRHNWLTRCFTAEYAVWFGTILPGLAHLGLVVPLGGTTLFFRRAILEGLGGWDAHNVTEDADLGLRLARHGYRTEIIATVTEEEPNARMLSWIRQRSRWIKGYAMTWGIHMRAPRQLWRELGPRRFWGMQVLFLGSISQALLAPVLWSFWIRALGLPHPLDHVLSPRAMTVLAVFFALTEAVNIAIGLWAVRGARHRHLWPWVPTLHFYFPLASLAAWKALYEVVTRPFYWDKTAHGVVGEAAAEPAPAVP